MSINIKPYRREQDYDRISEFLTRTYISGGKYFNWLQPRWEYMHFHPAMDIQSLNKIGVWEDEGEIVGVVHYEDSPGIVYFQIHPDYYYLKEEMLDYAESKLYEMKEGKKGLNVYINNYDKGFEQVVKKRGYIENLGKIDWISEWKIPEPFPDIKLPDGFHLQSLADENDLNKINRVLYRGFNHPGEPSLEDLESRKLMQMAPNFRKDLTIVVVDPYGNYVAFAGIWYDNVNKIAYVEPVATDPDYRMMGLGKAAVMESVRRTKLLGATHAYVESGKEFYMRIGFKKTYARNMWTKKLN